MTTRAGLDNRAALGAVLRYLLGAVGERGDAGAHAAAVEAVDQIAPVEKDAGD